MCVLACVYVFYFLQGTVDHWSLPMVRADDDDDDENLSGPVDSTLCIKKPRGQVETCYRDSEGKERNKGKKKKRER